MVSICGTGNVQPVFKSTHVVMKQITYWCPVHLVLNKPSPHKKKSCGAMSGDLAGHVMYGDPLPIHLAEDCSSKYVRKMLVGSTTVC